jgi:hypothetical protein
VSAELKPQIPSSLRGVIDAALEITRQRKDTLRQMKAAILEDDTDEVMRLAKDLCGVEDAKTSYRIDQGVH